MTPGPNGWWYVKSAPAACLRSIYIIMYQMQSCMLKHLTLASLSKSQEVLSAVEVFCFNFLFFHEPYLVFYLLVAQVPLPPSSHGIFSPFPTNGPTAREENCPLRPPLLLLRYEHLGVKLYFRNCTTVLAVDKENNCSLTTVCKQSTVKNYHGLADFIRNGAVFILSTVLKIH